MLSRKVKTSCSWSTGLNDQKIGKKLYVSLKTKFTKEVEECLQPQTLIGMMQKVTKEIGTKLRDSY